MHPEGYFALVLTEQSSVQLRTELATLAKPIAHHCTVKYGTCNPAHLPAPFAASDLGQPFALKVRGFKTRADRGVEAAVVALMLPGDQVVDHGFTENAIPHVTVATDGVTEPAEANAMLAEGFDAIDGPIIVATLVHTYVSSKE